MHLGGDRTEIRPLTGIRFVAAFVVFVFHVHIRVPMTDWWLLANLIGQGAVGMTLFFMLSGFILAYRYLGTDWTDGQFASARVARIYPVYAVSSLLAIPMLSFQMTDLRFGLLSAIVQLTIIAVTTLLMIQAWIPMLLSYLNNGANWSLSVEAFFYGTFILVARRIWSAKTATVLGLAALSYGLSLVPAVSYYAFENRPTLGLQIFYAMPIFRLGEFVIGVYLFVLLARGFFKPARLAITVAILVPSLIVYLMIVGGSLPIYMGHNWLAIPCIGGVLVYLTATTQGLPVRMLSSQIFNYLGRISYCFYCFQFHVLLGVAFLWPSLKESAWAYFVVSLLVLLVVSALGYHFIEEPARRQIQKRYHQLRTVPVS